MTRWTMWIFGIAAGALSCRGEAPTPQGRVVDTGEPDDGGPPDTAGPELEPLIDEIVVNNVRCSLADARTDPRPFCGESDVSFFLADGQDCDGVRYGATVWMEPDALYYSGSTFTMIEESSKLTSGTGAIWIDVQPDGGSTETWVSTSGTGTVELLVGQGGDDLVRASFEIQTVGFLDRKSPGPGVSGTLTCKRP